MANYVGLSIYRNHVKGGLENYLSKKNSTLPVKFRPSPSNLGREGEGAEKAGTEHTSQIMMHHSMLKRPVGDFKTMASRPVSPNHGIPTCAEISTEAWLLQTWRAGWRSRGFV